MFNHITRSERLTLPPEGQVLPALFMWITVPLVASFRPSHARTLLSSMCMALGAYACNLINVDIPPWELYTLLAGWAGITLNWLDRVVLANQDKEKWHKLTKEEVLIESKGEKTNLKSEFAIPDTIWGRASWSFAATPVLRGFEWSHQVKNIPKAPPSDTNRWYPLLCLCILSSSAE